MIFSVFQKIRFWGILGPPSYGIGATICIGREMLCLLYAGFFWITRQNGPNAKQLISCCGTHLTSTHLKLVEFLTNHGIKKKHTFSKHRPSGPMLSISPFVCLCACVCVHFEIPFKRLFAPTFRNIMSNNFRDSESLGKSNGKKLYQIRTLLLIKGVKSPRKKKSLFLGEFCKDQEVIQQGSGGYTTRIRRLYNKDREVMFSDAIIEPAKKPFTYKGCKITAQKKFVFLQIFSY